jgi:hypothetical protein
VVTQILHMSLVTQSLHMSLVTQSLHTYTSLCVLAYYLFIGPLRGQNFVHGLHLKWVPTFTRTYVRTMYCEIFVGVIFRVI